MKYRVAAALEDPEMLVFDDGIAAHGARHTEHHAAARGAVASRAGYSDQAHLIHDSREIAGHTPRELLGGAGGHELTEAFLARE